MVALAQPETGSWQGIRNQLFGQQRERDADPDALSESERAELKRLRKENAQLATDMEILRKAAAFFARETNR